MRTIKEYSNPEERDQFIQENANLTLIEEQTITEGNFLIFSDNPSVDAKQIVFGNIPQDEYDKQKNDLTLLQDSLKSADDKYKELDLSIADLQTVKATKMSQLEEACNQTIANGFDFTINSISYKFSCSLEAQSNFQGVDTLFRDGLVTEAEWTVTNNETNKIERIVIDKTTFSQLKLQVFQHINSQISKLRNTLQLQVEVATTNQEVDVIVW